MDDIVGEKSHHEENQGTRQNRNQNEHVSGSSHYPDKRSRSARRMNGAGEIHEQDRYPHGK